MHPGSLRYSSLAYDEYASLLAPCDPGASASALRGFTGTDPYASRAAPAGERQCPRAPAEPASEAT